MSPTEIIEIRQTLEVRRDELLAVARAEIQDGIGRLKVLRDVSGEGDDDDHSVDAALSQMRSQTLARIETALERIQDGTYGLCKECGEEINIKRLRALAFAVRCKECEESEELRKQREAASGRVSGMMGLFALS